MRLWFPSALLHYVYAIIMLLQCACCQYHSCILDSTYTGTGIAAATAVVIVFLLLGLCCCWRAGYIIIMLSCPICLLLQCYRQVNQDSVPSM